MNLPDVSTLKANAPDMLALASSLTELRKASTSAGGEWNGACPFCRDGNDRFVVQPYHQPEARWLCRTCTDGKWRDVIDLVERRDNTDFLGAVRALFGPTVSISREDAAAIRAEQTRRNAEREAQEAREQAERRQELDASRIHIHYHQHRGDAGTLAWAERGLSPMWQEYFCLGYQPGREFWHGEQAFTSASLTIPYLRAALNGDDLSWECVGLVHRLLTPNAPGGKYRPHRPGLGKPLFRCDLFDPEIRGEVLLVEGEIKAMVTWAAIQEHIGAVHPAGAFSRMQVVGCAGKNFSPAHIAELSKANRVWICFDPDARADAERTANMLGRHRCQVLDLGGKIDDLMLDGSMDAESVGRLMFTARRVG